MKEVRRIARAKINLGLDVIGKRDNGYHDVRMIMQTINLHDKLRLKKIQANKILMETNLPFLPRDERNLVVQIIKYFRETYDIKEGVFVDLFKVIPVGAGLAGGSTDGAQTIYGMNELFELNLSLDEMLKIGGKFGADIPYCIIGGTALAEGIGEELTTLPALPEMNLLVAKPRVSVSTAYVYGHLSLDEAIMHPDIDGMVRAIEMQSREGVISRLGNVLEDVTVKGYKEVLDIKNALIASGAKGALMTGSGSAVFGIYENASEAKEAARKLRKHPLIRYVFETATYNE